jgi:cobalt-zinc-cadmium resistance protein CzcA
MQTWTSGRSKEALIQAMSAKLESVPGVSFNFTQPMAMRLDEVVSGVKADVAVKIFGPDAETLERLGGEVAKTLSDLDGVADLQAEVLSGAAQLQIAVDRTEIARYGLSVADVRHAVETAVGGVTATEVLDGPRRVPVVVRLPDAVRADAAAVGSLLLSAPGGERIPLSRVAALVEMQAPELIAHEDGERRLVVQMNVRGRDVGSFVADAQRRVTTALSIPPGYRVEWGGQFENQARATARLALAVPLSIAIIFGLLFVAGAVGNSRRPESRVFPYR